MSDATRDAGAPVLAGAALALALLAGGCRTDLPPLVSDPPARAGTTLPPAPEGGYDLDRPYTLLPGDVIDITVRDDPNLSTPITIESDGGFDVYKSEDEKGERKRIKARGKTVEDLQRELADIYQPKFTTRPYVLVSLTKPVRRVVFVRGAIKTKEGGTLELLPGRRMTLYRAIQAAGELEEDADLSRVSLIRKDPTTGSEVSFPLFDLEEMAANLVFDRDPPLEPNDLITIRPLGKVSIWGMVNKPGTYRCYRGLTLLKLLADAEGTKEFGAMGDVRVVRGEATGREQVYTVDLRAVFDGKAPDPLLAPGDRIWVYETWR